MIHKVRIQNFKSIADVTVELSPVTVLVGRSGTGKSTFIQAIRFLRDLIGQRDGAIVFSNLWHQLRPAVETSDATCFEFEFSIRGIDDRFIYELSLWPNNVQLPPIRESLKLGQKCFFHQESKDVHRGDSKWVVPPDLVKPPEAGSIAIGRIPSISEVVSAFVALTAGIGCYIFSDDVLKEHQNSNSSSHRTSLAPSGLDDSATNFLEVLREIVSNLQDLKVKNIIVESLRRLNPTVSSVELDDFRQPKHILVGHRFNGRTLPLQLLHESDGFRRFCAMLLALYQRPPKQTLMFEHPEDGIHPGAVALLADEFKAAYGNNRGQIILTTHSPQLLDQFDSDNIRVVELDGFRTKIGPVSDEQKDAIREQLLTSGELLTVDPARIQQAADA